MTSELIKFMRKMRKVLFGVRRSVYKRFTMKILLEESQKFNAPFTALPFPHKRRVLSRIFN